MAAKTAPTTSDGFTAAERAAMKQRAAELRAEGKQGTKKADGLLAVLEAIEKMTPEDRVSSKTPPISTTGTCGRSLSRWCPGPRRSSGRLSSK